MKRKRRPNSPPPQSHTLRLLKGGRHTNKSISTRPSESESDLPASEFLVPVQDSHGHSAPVSARVPPQMKRELQIIVGRRAFPFETESDLVRWCIKYGVELLVKKTKDRQILNTHQQVSSWLEISRHHLEMMKYGRMLSETKAILKRLADEGCVAKARTILRHVENNIENIDDEYWRSKYEKEILRQFRWLDRQKELKEARDRKRKERSRRRKN